MNEQCYLHSCACASFRGTALGIAAQEHGVCRVYFPSRRPGCTMDRPHGVAGDPHAQATYLLKASGHSMVEAGIFDGDIMVVDKAIKHRHGHIVVAVVDGDFTVKRLYQRSGRKSLSLGWHRQLPAVGKRQISFS